MLLVFPDRGDGFLMDRRFSLVLLSSLFVVLLLLSSCGPNRIGTIPRGTPDTGNGTPAVIPTTNTSIVAAPASPGSTGKMYAFIRNDQFWVALNGAAPVQMTHFDYAQVPNVFWQHPAWSPDDNYVALIMNASPSGSGGGGCPDPDFATEGAFYLLNTATKQFSAITLPSVKNVVQMDGTPRNDTWQYVFWEDAKHVLAWYNGTAGNGDNAAGLYRYDVTTQQLSPVLPLSALGVTTLANPQKGMPLLLSMRYSHGQLFYQAVVHPFEEKSQLVIYRYPVEQSSAKSSEVFSMGSEAWCAASSNGPYMRPGWDISPDGAQLVAQVMLTGNPNAGVSAVQSLNLEGGSTTALFDQMPSDLLSHDLSLSWGPDSQAVVATEYHPLLHKGPYVASLSNPTAMQQYGPALSGAVVWRSDGTAFALQQVDMTDTAEVSTVYMFLVGDTRGRTLLTDAHEFAWG
jgi:hypothetical protein